MKERVLITVKTYPVLSKKYAELVCTAGVNEQGEWRRLYPIRFRALYGKQQYKKYQWIEVELEPSNTDDRPESHKIVHDSLRLLGNPLSSQNYWSARKVHFLEKVAIHEDLRQLIGQAHDNQLSLAAFKPARMISFKCEEVDRDWDPDGLAILEKEKRQFDLFASEEDVASLFSVVDKLPYKFSYEFEDITGKRSTLMIEDWEIGMLYWNSLKASDGNESLAIEMVRKKYWGEFVESRCVDLTILLGTTLQFHRMKAPNPFVIVGVVYPKRNSQGSLF